MLLMREISRMPDGDGEARVTRRYTIGGKARASVSRTHHSAVRNGRTRRGGLTTGVEAVEGASSWMALSWD